MINVALIGAGYWGSKYIKVLNTLDDVNLKWICKQNIHGLSFNNTKFTTNVDDLLEDKEVDCVIIATPVETHYKIVKKCILANKHILVEKPFTLNSTEAEKLIELNKEKNLIILPGHIYLHHTGIQKLKEIIDFEIISVFVKRMSTSKYPNSLSEIAIHDIYILEYLFGKPVKPKNVMGNIFHCISNIMFNNIETYIESCSDYPGKIREIIIKGKNKKIIFNEVIQNKITIFDLYTNNVVEFDESISPLKLQCQHFFNCIKGKDIPIVTEKDGLKTIKTLEKLYKLMIIK